ncbi:hypothetical protein [Aurantibacillus circumpalustris]|uniref:hypothetical protein n=1 Tax=Aurantibacillus circumpalustris TaxID=3036359 RepID=UPI00295AAC8A|nr:hypothetical protein [Aurantibacillus circumpalustris]
MHCKKIHNYTFGLCIFFSCVFSFEISAQFYNFPSDNSFSVLTEKQLAAKDSAIHGGIKPYVHFFSSKYVQVVDTHRLFKFIKDDPAIDLVFYKHFIRVEPKTEKFKLRLDPVLNLEVGKDFSNNPSGRLYCNTRGLIGSGYVGDNVYFETMVVENQSFLPSYLSDYANTSSVIPGQGRWKQFKTTGYDYAFSSGFVSVQALKNLNIQVGHGKQKIGNGYRSLLLSDNTLNYPYTRFTQQWFKGKVQYTNIYAVLMNLVSASTIVNPNTERLFQKKAASFQYLSINFSRSFNIGFFQGMVWQAGDSRNKQHIDWQYFNPIIYTNLMSYGLDNKNNIITGLDAKLKIGNKVNVYSQLMLDKTKSDSTSAAWGWQAGLNYFDAFGLKNLFLQFEYNNVKRGSYSSSVNTSDQSYSHYNQNLAYTPGYGEEFVLIADYKVRRFFVNLRYNYQDIPQNTISGTNTNYVSMINAKVGYLINPSYNLNICLGILYRTQKNPIFNPLNNQVNYIYLGFKTSLYNLYYDF